MSLPSYVLGILYALLLGSLFHVWRDGGFGRLVLYLGLSLAGAAAGQWIGTWRNWRLIPLGALDIGLMTLGSLLFLLLGHWLSLVEIRGTEGSKRKV